jgi:hypothetical protein
VVALVAVVAVIAMAAGAFTADEDSAPADGPRWSATT